MNRLKIIERLHKLVEDGEQLAQKEYFEAEHWLQHTDIIDGSGVNVWEELVRAGYTLPEDSRPAYEQWKLSCTSLLRDALGIKSLYFDAFKRNEQVALKVAALKAALEEFETGLVRPLVVAAIFTGMLDQAEELHKSGYKDAAAIVGRVALEQSLREMAQGHSLPEGADPKASAATLNDALRKIDVYGKPLWRQISAWLDIGNAAAHGDWGQYGDTQVQGMLDGIRSFIEPKL